MKIIIKEIIIFWATSYISFVYNTIENKSCMPGETKQLFELSVLQQNLSWVLDWYYWAYQVRGPRATTSR